MSSPHEGESSGDPSAGATGARSGCEVHHVVRDVQSRSWRHEMSAVGPRLARRGSRYRPTGIAGVTTLLAVAALGLAPGATAGWRLYGHDLANSRDAGSAGPSPSEVGSISRAWTFKSPTGDFTGTPVVSHGVLVAGDNGGTVYALDAHSGHMLWSKDLGQPINGSAAIDPRAPGG